MLNIQVESYIGVLQDEKVEEPVQKHLVVMAFDPDCTISAAIF